MKKPYNPILGEIFNCSWRVYGDNKSKETILVTYKSEQVSHNPAGFKNTLYYYFFLLKFA